MYYDSELSLLLLKAVGFFLFVVGLFFIVFTYCKYFSSEKNIVEFITRTKDMLVAIDSVLCKES